MLKVHPGSVSVEAARQLGGVARLEGDHVEPVAAHGDRARFLGEDLDLLGHRARGDVDHGDAVA